MCGSPLDFQPACIAGFSYDGDGQRVKRVSDGGTTYYIGNHTEWRVQQGVGTLTTYYYADGQRVAMRQGSTFSYLLTDHLGSTSVTVDSSGAEIAELRYKPWGETRYESGSTPTDRRFTGQTLDRSTGLYFYGARYYDPAIGRFIQADTIVPEPGNPQALNRYAYVANNPLSAGAPRVKCPQANEERYLYVVRLSLLLEDEHIIHPRILKFFRWPQVIQDARAATG